MAFREFLSNETAQGESMDPAGQHTSLMLRPFP